MWNLRLELGHRLHPTPMRTTAFAPAQAEPLPVPLPDKSPSLIYGPPEWAWTARAGIFAGADFREQPDGTLRSPADHPLYAQECRREHDDTVRVVYAARIAHCRACELQEQCLGHGKETKHPRRVSAVVRAIEGPSPPPAMASVLPAALLPILWGDWSRSQTRRSFITLLHTQTVTITQTRVASPKTSTEPSGPITREQRVHCRLSWAQRVARNAACAPTQSTKIHLFGIPTAFALSVGLAVA